MSHSNLSLALFSLCRPISAFKYTCHVTDILIPPPSDGACLIPTPKDIPSGTKYARYARFNLHL
jgi:hypothetical protein